MHRTSLRTDARPGVEPISGAILLDRDRRQAASERLGASELRYNNDGMVGSASRIARAVRQSVARRAEIQAAYVFGSAATGRMRRDSDVDVAVLVGGTGVRRTGTMDYRSALMADLGAALRRPDVDVVILNEAPALLAHRVLSRGRLVFERSRSARVRFQVRTAARYQDLIPMYETQIHYMKRAARRRSRIG